MLEQIFLETINSLQDLYSSLLMKSMVQINYTVFQMCALSFLLAIGSPSRSSLLALPAEPTETALKQAQKA